MRAKKLKVGEGDWTCMKEFLGWKVNTESSTVYLPKRKLEKLTQMSAILSTQCHIGQKDLEQFCSMLLALPGVIAHLYHIQRAMTQGGEDRAWLLPYFHQ